MQCNAVQCADDRGDGHGGPQTLSTHISHHDQHSPTTFGRRAEEIAAYVPSGLLDALDIETRNISRRCNQSLLYRARGVELGAELIANAPCLPGALTQHDEVEQRGSKHSKVVQRHIERSDCPTISES